jgi:putative glycosyltransferase
MKLSIVTTLYETAPFLDEFYERSVAAAAQITSDFEIILVNDGSPDDALERAIRLHQRDARVAVIDLSRNFGHHKAMMTGLTYAQGELVFLIDSDLDESPETLQVLKKRMMEERADVAYGVQRARRGGFFERATGRLFYWAVGKLCEVSLPPDLMTARLMTRRYVRNLIRHREREIIIAGIWQITGFHQIAVELEKRVNGKRTSYAFFSKLRLAINFITSFSNSALYLILYLGLSISFLSFIGLATLFFRFMLFNHPAEGWTSVIASVWLFGGLTIMLVGFIGIYVARIFTEVKRRPYTIVRAVHRAPGHTSGSDGR